MTIHSDWSRILHQECPEAFLKKAAPPNTLSAGCRFNVGIIDGHLQLMRLDARMKTWECFIRNQFLKPIQSFFQHGCKHVVLCFDNYSAVPVYKAMTQQSRCSKVVVRNFSPTDELPPVIPDEPVTFLMNRNFKLKLIEMLCERIPELVVIEKGQEFILDYKRVVAYSCAQPRFPIIMQDMQTMGESDVKFCRYVSKYGNALVHAVDGDYMAIALLYYTKHGLQPSNHIFIYRQLAVLQSTASTASAKKKRKLAQQQNEEEDNEEAQGSKPKCWVNMQMVYRTITKVMAEAGVPGSDPNAVFSIVFLMLCAGTDFSRNTPFLGPKRIWDAIPSISNDLLEALRDQGMEAKMFLNCIIAKIYALNYQNHLKGMHPSRTQFKDILFLLQKSKLSEGTKKKLPSEERMLVTIRNLEWVIKYWTTENGLVDTPLDGVHGYSQDAKGNIIFSDMEP